MLKALGGVAAGVAIAPADAVRAGKAKVSGQERIGLTDPLYFSSATAIARAIKEKHVSSEEVTSAFLERIRHVNPKIHAVVQLRAEVALDLAREADRKLSRGEYLGPLHGVPITIKDSLDTIGLVSTAGTKGRASFIPKRDASVVARLKASGAIVMGKTNTPELTLHGYTENLLYERTNNPYSIDHSPMGSSGGAAAIVAAGGSAFDIGSDTGGSVRIPSHACGVCGLKPTAGRVSRTGHILSYDTFNQALTTLGPIARYVEDLVTILPIISGSDGIDPFAFDIPIGDYRETNIANLSFAFYTDNGVAAPISSVDSAVRQVASRIETTGAAMEENRPAESANILELFWKITGADGGYSINRILKENGTKEVSPYMAWAQGNVEQYETASISPKQFGELFTKWHSAKSNMTRFFTDYDVLLCPASAIPAPTHNVAMQELEATMLSYTAIYNITGWPVAVVRIGTSADGLPIGIQIVGKPWQEAVVLAVAKFVEQEFAGFVPPAI
jgi:amidase